MRAKRVAKYCESFKNRSLCTVSVAIKVKRPSWFTSRNVVTGQQQSLWQGPRRLLPALQSPANE